MIHKLVTKGYSVDIANSALDEIDLENDDELACRNALKKALRLYSSLDEEKENRRSKNIVCEKGFRMMKSNNN